MEILTSKLEITEFLTGLKKEKKTIGFVPTMGALHKGHLSLIHIAAELCNSVVCSIFVNPTQFTDAKDLEKYPRPIEADIDLLKSSKCDVLFLPSVDEMYAESESWHIDLGYLETILEGKFRPGHYQGVTQIVKKLIDVVQPNYMFMGQKDFQQVLVLEHMIKKCELPVELVMCPIVREDDGLALSSRNIHLDGNQRHLAGWLSKVLHLAQQNFETLSIDRLKAEAWNTLNGVEGIVPEYFEICDAETLLTTPAKTPQNIVALVAAKIGKVRLIDNIILK